MPLDPPPEVFAAPTAAPAANGAVFAAGFAPGTPPAPPAPAAANPHAIGAVFAPPVATIVANVVGGDTVGPSDPWFWPVLLDAGLETGRKAFYATGVIGDDPPYVIWNGGYWSLMYSSGMEWISYADVATPDLVPPGDYDSETNEFAWQPNASVTGSPVVSLVPALPAPAVIGPAANTPGTPPAPPSPAAAAPQSVGAVFASGFAPATPPSAFVAPTASPVTPPAITP